MDVDETRLDGEIGAGQWFAAREGKATALPIAPATSSSAPTRPSCWTARRFGKPVDDGGRRRHARDAVRARAPGVHRRRRGDRRERIKAPSRDRCRVSGHRSGRGPPLLAQWGARDKAGAYAIQGLGGLFVERIEGSYSGVVGLPVFETAALLRESRYRHHVG